MAKKKRKKRKPKRRAKRRKVKTVKRVAARRVTRTRAMPRARVVRARVAAREDRRVRHWGYVFGMIGGVITVIVGILTALVTTLLTFFAGLGGIAGVWGIICGAIMIIGAGMLKGRNVRTGAVLLVVFSALGLVSLQGWFIGPIIGLIGGIAVLTRR